MEYKGYSIEENAYRHPFFPNFDYKFYNLNDCDELQGNGMDIEDCQEQIDSLIIDRL